MNSTNKPTRPSLIMTIADERWTTQRVLAEARRRTRELAALDRSVCVVREMLANLLLESGWNEEQFIDALCRDVVRRQRLTNRRVPH